MAKTYAQLTAEIEALRAKAEILKQKEVATIIAQSKVAIAYYGLTAADLGLDGASERSRRSPASKPATRKGVARYGDGGDNTWTGMGPRPRWLKEALAAGRSLEEFMFGSDAKPAKSPRVSKEMKPGGKLPAKYRDDAGNSWSGRGSTPRWIKAALDGGKTLEQLAV